MLNSEKKCATCSHCDEVACASCMSCKAFSNWQSKYPDYWARISAIKDKQTSKGVEEYGQTLEENTDISPIERLTMLEEELIDGLMYIEHLKECIKEHGVWR